MSTVISAGTTTNTAYNVNADTSGSMVLATGSGPTTAVTIDNSQNTTLAGYLNAPNTFGFKNRIINGAMAISQRGTSFTLSGSAYTLDRWYALYSASPPTVAQVAGIGGYSKALQVTGAASNTNIYMIQRIESLNCSDLSGATVTIQVVLQGSSSQTVAWGLQYANSTDNFSSVTNITSGTWSVTTSATTFTATVTGLPSGVLNGFQFYLSPNNGGAFTSGTLTYTGVQLEKGSTATSFDYRPYGTELALCQRYFEMSYDQGTTPGSSTVLGMSVGYFPASVSGANIRFPVTFQVTKRADPSLSYWDGAGNASKETVWAANNAQTNNVNGGSQSFVNVGERGFSFNDANLGAYYSFGIHWTASAEL